MALLTPLSRFNVVSLVNSCFLHVVDCLLVLLLMSGIFWTVNSRSLTISSSSWWRPITIRWMKKKIKIRNTTNYSMESEHAKRYNKSIQFIVWHFLFSMTYTARWESVLATWIECLPVTFSYWNISIEQHILVLIAALKWAGQGWSRGIWIRNNISTHTKTISFLLLN